MPDPLLLLLAVPALLLVAAAVAALAAVASGRDAGVLASVAVLAPLSEAARAARTLPRLARGGMLPRLGAIGLLALAALRVLLLPVDGVVLIDTPIGVGAFVVLDLLSWACWAPLARTRPRRLLLRALAVELPVVLALAGPVVAARSLSVVAIAAQPLLPFAAQMPVVPVVLLAGIGLTTPWSAAAAPPLADRLAPAERLLADAARTASLVAGCAVAAVLLLGTTGAGGAARAAVAAVVLAVLLVVVGRRVPAFGPERASRGSLVVLLPVAALQLAVVVVLALLAG